MTKKEFCASSSDKKHTLRGVVYIPDTAPKGFFHIVHGMTEHIGRYDKIMTALAEEGYIAFGYDNLGHGKTADCDCELGYIAKKEGWRMLCRDVGEFSSAVIKQYDTEKKLPYYLMGHSMGSFIVRLASLCDVRPDKLIIMGTSGSNPAASAGLAVISVIKLIFGDRHISPLLENIAFGSYNNRFKEENDEKSWLSCDKSVRERYCQDKYCTFKFTSSAMGDLVGMIKKSNSKKWYDDIDKKMPILLLSGENDPVGNYGNGVREVYERLKKQGACAECKLYPGARHEILNDFTYDDVKRDILEFIKK